MMQYVRPFGQLQGANSATLAVTGTTGRVAVPVSGIGFRSLRIANAGTQTIFVNFGTSTVNAVIANDMPILAGSVEVFLLPPDITHVAAIASTTGSTMYLTVGEGV